MGRRWWRDTYAREVWSAELHHTVKIILLAYADHAADKDTAWLPLDRLARVSGMARSTAARRLADAVALGWLELAERGRQHRASRYRLTIPSSLATGPLSTTPSSPAPDTSSPAPDTSSPGEGTDYSEENTEEASSSTSVDELANHYRQQQQHRQDQT